MIVIVLLDAGPLGLLTNPGASPETLACNAWLDSLLADGVQVLVPEITDYEVRRELLRADKLRGIMRLDALKIRLGYLPITTDVMLTAAEFWASARRRGRPTAPNDDLDCDMILAAQAKHETVPYGETVVATTNIRHLSLFADARRWHDIEV